MVANLIDLVSKQLTPSLVGKLGGVVGESPSTVTRAASLGVPTIVGALAQQGSTEVGARGLFDTIRAGGYDSMDVGSIGSMLDQPDGKASLLQRGQILLTSLFGGGLNNVAGGLGGRLGLSPRSSSGILAMLAPIVMSVIGQHVRTNNLSPAGLSTLLRGQSSFMPGTAHGAREVAIAGEHAHRPKRNWLWPLLAIGVAAFGGFLLCSRERPDVSMSKPAAPHVEAPAAPETPHVEAPAVPEPPNFQVPPVGGGPPAPEVTPPSETPEAAKPEMGAMGQRAQGVDALGSFLESGSGTERFELSGLNYETNGSNLTDEGRAMVGRIADELEKSPDAKLSIEGFTDNTGSDQTNHQLSLSRAMGVKNELVSHGIEANRIQVTGRGPENPIATNDTDEGRAMNRRTELVVQK